MEISVRRGGEPGIGTRGGGVVVGGLVDVEDGGGGARPCGRKTKTGRGAGGGGGWGGAKRNGRLEVGRGEGMATGVWFVWLSWRDVRLSRVIGSVLRWWKHPLGRRDQR